LSGLCWTVIIIWNHCINSLSPNRDTLTTHDYIRLKGKRYIDHIVIETTTFKENLNSVEKCGVAFFEKQRTMVGRSG
jgi:hypothetical protein